VSRYPDVAATNPFTVNVRGHFGKTEMSRMSRTGKKPCIYRHYVPGHFHESGMSRLSFPLLRRVAPDLRHCDERATFPA
jgi:hypothetical protein